MKEQNEALDIKGRLRTYLAVIFEFFDVSDLKAEQWTKLEINFKERHENRKKDAEAKIDPLEIKPNFFDLVLAKLNGDAIAIKFFDLIKKLLEELADRFDDSEKAMLNKTLYNLLISPKEDYLHFVGELLVLNGLTKSGNFKLLSLESTIAGNRSADFELQHLSSGRKMLVEVTNLHLDEGNTRLVTRLKDHYDRKLDKKIQGETSYNHFSLVPVIWSPVADLERVWKLYQEQQVTNPVNVLEPSAFVTVTDAEGRVDYRFGTISTLLTGAAAPRQSKV
jgi:uncharacterized coiled-coil protein SlyX